MIRAVLGIHGNEIASEQTAGVSAQSLRKNESVQTWTVMTFSCWTFLHEIFSTGPQSLRLQDCGMSDRLRAGTSQFVGDSIDPMHAHQSSNVKREGTDDAGFTATRLPQTHVSRTAPWNFRKAR
jgi:hypothetical protein